MEEIVSVQTHEETVRRLTEQVGSWMEARPPAEVEVDGEPKSEDEQPLQRCVISPDGAMISLVHKQWVETRTVAIGEPQEKLNAKGETEIHVGKLSYFSRLADAFTFTKLAEVEMQRRKVREAKEVCAVMDGADWLQFFTDKHRPDAHPGFSPCGRTCHQTARSLGEGGHAFSLSYARSVFTYPQTSRSPSAPAYG